MVSHQQPYYVIGVAKRILGLHEQTLRYYERAGLVKPRRSEGGIRLYSESDIERIRQIRRLMEDLGVNLAGVEVVLKMNEQLRQLQQEVERLNQEIGALQERLHSPS